MSEYDDAYSELESQLSQLCNTLPVRNDKHSTLTKIGKVSLRIDALQELADEEMKARFPWCLLAVRTNTSSSTAGGFRPGALGVYWDYKYMVSSKERERYGNHYRCPCDVDNNRHWHKLTCVVTFDDWGDGPECNLCGKLQGDGNEIIS